MNQQESFAETDWQAEETNFRNTIKKDLNMLIIDMASDGNCMYRAIAAQAYGDAELYNVVRQKCIDFIVAGKSWFKDFVPDNEDFDAYCSRKRQEASWGDNLEQQAIAEMYKRSIKIYAYSSEPMRTFYETQDSSKEPFRLSYHGKSHYNSIMPISWT